jgi:sucrose-phosphate synthase
MSQDAALYLQLFSIHGLIRGKNLELGRDADTGGQTKYVVELAKALGEQPEVERVDLFTRLIEDKRVSKDYAEPLTPLSDKARIVRLPCGPKRYVRKELLWPYLDEFVDEALRFTRQEGRLPDLVHGHYADAGYVASELAGFLGVPLIFTGHSLGRAKLKVLLGAGLSEEEIDKQYQIQQRIRVEEEVMRKADMVIASTNHEIAKEYEHYEARDTASFEVIPPGIDIDRFYPYYYDEDENHDIPEVLRQARANMRQEIGRFLNNPNKPLILAISRPDRRKNIDGLVTAYGEDKELQAMANLAIFAGVRKDIRMMDDNERSVLTELLLLMDTYDLYGKLALPKKHDPELEIPVLYRLAAASRGVFVNPALTENFGITLIEASSSGLPIVSTDHGGPKDIISNCRSGILIDASRPGNISTAIKKILIDPELWRQYSNNGVSGVRRHYSWEAHCWRYLKVVARLCETSTATLTEPSWRSAVGRHLSQVDRLLISDIDHTLLGDDAALAELSAVLRAEHPKLGFGVATGRSLELIKEGLAEHDLPTPDVTIAAVGSEIYYGREFLPDHGYAQHIAYGWQPEIIRKALSRLDLELQPEANQRRFKISYYLPGGNDQLAEVHHALSQAKVRYTLIYSHGQFLDILPYRASKGKAVRYLSHKWSIPAERTAVAGDSGNDEEMLRGSFMGIVVGNYSEELARLKGKRRVYFAKGHYATGVLEGLKHYRFITAE